MRDFFISYTGVNQDWAEWIAWSLEEAGYTVILQKWDFRAGSNFILNMDRAAKEATSTIAVLSSEYLDADFPRTEWAAALAADPTGRKGSLVPVRVRDCRVDGLLKSVVYIDLVGLDEEAARQSLLGGVANGRSKPTSAPRFPGAQAALSLQPKFPGQEARELSPAAPLESSLAVLRACPGAVPGEVLADVEQITREEFARHSAVCVDRQVLNQDHELFLLPQGLQTVAPEPVPDLLARTLDALLRYYAKHKHDGKGRNQIRNIVALSRACASLQVGPLARVFNVVEKGLKYLGDKTLVLDIARLSIQSCQHQPRGTQEVEWEAQALVCGVCWVFQRRGQLEDALAAAEKSLHLGEQVGYERNSAFCHKCLGRLYRIMAETDKTRRRELVSKSIEHLEEAVKRFSAMPAPEFGPDSHQVGDCYSLRGRTFLFANRLQDADDSIRRATRLINDQNTKDYSDLLILAGDLHAAKTEYETANQYYDSAIDLGRPDDAERSEILARAFFARGRSYAALVRKQSAHADFGRAQEIWHSLGEPEGVAQCRWEEIRLDDTLASADIELLETQPPRVRVIAYERHQERLSALPKGRARRAATPRPYWQQLLKEAEQQVAIEGVGC